MLQSLLQGNIPTASDFGKPGMPPHTVIRQRYKKKLSEWLKENYPERSKTYDGQKEQYTRMFIEDYHKIKPKSQSEFNRNKRPETRDWQTVAKYHNVKSWRKLLKTLDLPLYYDMARDHVPKKVTVNVHIDGLEKELMPCNTGAYIGQGE